MRHRTFVVVVYLLAILTLPSWASVRHYHTPGTAPLPTRQPESSRSATLKGGYFACFTRSAWVELNQHIAHDDRRGIDLLLQNKQCFMPKSGVEILVLTSIWGTAKVRAHAGEIPVILWTNTENVSQ